MNYLQLTQTLHRLARIGQQELGTAPTSVLDQTGVLGELAAFIDLAWSDIQNDQSRWRFMVATGTLTLQQGASSLDPAALTNFDSIAPADSEGRGRFITRFLPGDISNETPVHYVPYELFLQSRLQRGVRPVSAPSHFTITPQHQFLFDATADTAYSIRFNYRRTNQTLVQNADTPIMRDRFHMTIVWWALEKYYCTTRDGTAELLQKSAAQRKRMMQKLLNEELEEPLGFGATV